MRTFFQKYLFCTFIIFSCLCVLDTLAVKKNDFKTCEQSGFCTRNRAFAEKASEHDAQSKYSIVGESIQWRKDSGNIICDVLNHDSGVLFSLTLTFLEDEIVRIHLDDKSSIKKRYEVKDVLIDETLALSKSPYEWKEVKNGVFLIEFGRYNSAILTLSPLSIDLYSQQSLIASINRKGWLNIEHYRQKPVVEEQEPSEVAQGDFSDEEEQTTGSELSSNDPRLTQGEWEETFHEHTDSKPFGPSSIGLDITFVGSSHVYGIPEHASSLSLKTTRGGENAYTEPFRLYNLDVFEFELDSNMALYGSVPFMISHKIDHKLKKPFSSGVFWLNAAETWIDITRDSESQLIFQNNYDSRSSSSSGTISTTTHWISESGVMDLFVLLGPTAHEVQRQYAMLTGSQNLPQLFSLGYHQCRWNYMDVNEVTEVLTGFEKHDIPMDVIWLDIEHTDEKKYFTWHKSKFVDPIAMQNEVASLGRKMVTIIDPHIKRDDGFHVKSQGSAKGLFVKKKDGSEFDGWCWPGSSSWLDFTNPEARLFWMKLFSFDSYQGSTENLFTWNDMNEPSVFNGPEITMHKDLLHWKDWEHRDVHNIYGMLLHRSTYGAHVYRSLPSKDGNHLDWRSRSDASGPLPHRPFVLSRAFFAGTQRYGAIWTGDNMAKWEHLQSSAPMLLSISVAGVGFCGVDVGGFFFNPEPELLVRWYQAGLFYPFFRGHAHIDTKRREPWIFGEPYTSLIRNAIVTRYRLLPYWYTLFRHGQLRGTTPLRPLFFEFPKDERLFSVEDQYMIGAGLMVKPNVKPLASGGDHIDVFLPGSQNWYNMYSLIAYRGGNKHSFTGLSLETPSIALIRSGYIIPLRNRIRRSATVARHDPLSFVAALNSTGTASGDLYLDDGESYHYVMKGEFVHQQIDVQLKGSDEILISSKNILYDTYDADIEKKRRKLKNWQRPFIAETLYDDAGQPIQNWLAANRAMTSTSSQKYRYSVNELVRVESFTIAGPEDLLKSWIKAKGVLKVSQQVSPSSSEENSASPETLLDFERHVSVEVVKESNIYGKESSSPDGNVLPTVKIVIKNPGVGACVDFQITLRATE